MIGHAAPPAAAPTATAPVSAAATAPVAATVATTTTTTAVAAAVGVLVARESDGVHHHVFFIRAFRDRLQREIVRTAVGRHVHAVGEDEHHATPFDVKQRRHADADGVPERRRAGILQ